jgi:hypothetical protein
VAQQLIRDGFRGCWVLALGTNDTADVAIGSVVSRPARIRQMMSVIGNRPFFAFERKNGMTEPRDPITLP